MAAVSWSSAHSLLLRNMPTRTMAACNGSSFTITYE